MRRHGGRVHVLVHGGIKPKGVVAQKTQPKCQTLVCRAILAELLAQRQHLSQGLSRSPELESEPRHILRGPAITREVSPFNRSQPPLDQGVPWRERTGATAIRTCAEPPLRSCLARAIASQTGPGAQLHVVHRLRVAKCLDLATGPLGAAGMPPRRRQGPARGGRGRRRHGGSQAPVDSADEKCTRNSTPRLNNRIGSRVPDRT